MMTAAAPPPAAVIAAIEELNINVTHVYGLTEVYGPAVVCAWKDAWNELPLDERARMKARQGVAYEFEEDVAVLDPATSRPVPWDGQTQGEIGFRGNIVMKGYLKNEEATDKAFKDGWFWSGDLAVQHPDGYIEIRDRAKDIIISGGENISSIEVENALYSTLQSRWRPWWQCRTRNGAKCPAPSSNWPRVSSLKHKARAKPNCSITRPRALPGSSGLKVVFTVLPKTSTGKVLKTDLRERAKSLAS